MHLLFWNSSKFWNSSDFSLTHCPAPVVLSICWIAPPPPANPGGHIELSCRWRNWVSERLSHLLKVLQAVNDRAGVCLIPNPLSVHSLHAAKGTQRRWVPRETRAWRAQRCPSRLWTDLPSSEKAADVNWLSTNYFPSFSWNRLQKGTNCVCRC